VLPADSLRISYTLDNNHPIIGCRPGPSKSPKRSSAKSWPPLAPMGFSGTSRHAAERPGRGGSLENAIVVGKRSVLNDSLRFPTSSSVTRSSIWSGTCSPGAAAPGTRGRPQRGARPELPARGRDPEGLAATAAGYRARRPPRPRPGGGPATGSSPGRGLVGRHPIPLPSSSRRSAKAEPPPRRPDAIMVRLLYGTCRRRSTQSCPRRESARRVLVGTPDAEAEVRISNLAVFLQRLRRHRHGGPVRAVPSALHESLHTGIAAHVRYLRRALQHTRMGVDRRLQARMVERQITYNVLTKE